MKTITQRNLLLGVLALGLAGFAGQAQARTDIDVEVNLPLPGSHPRAVERWESPGYDAVWVKPHHEWVDGRWEWFDGYYEYPPHTKAVYVEGRYYKKHGHHYWRKPYWR